MKTASIIALRKGDEWKNDQEKKQTKFRERIRDLYYVHDWSRRQIARAESISRHTVDRWTQSPDQDCSQDKRGWKRGVRRVHSDATIKRILTIHSALDTSQKRFFTGATAIDQEWRRRYKSTPPPLRTIGRVLKEYGVSSPRKRQRSTGAAAYLHYPEYTIYTGLCGRVLEADFIGRKYLTGQSEPLHFISYSFKYKPCLRHFQRVASETADVFISQTERFFDEFETPDFLKVDNCAATIGSNSAKRTISRVVQFLLSHHVVPIFAVPRRPFSQASIEGSNSLFARKFWNTRTFTSTKDIDRQLVWFNDAIRSYHGYQTPPTHKNRISFQPRILFLRQVRQHPDAKQEGYIDILHELIRLPEAYINYFVLAVWDLEKEMVSVALERDHILHQIIEVSFCINTKNISY